MSVLERNERRTDADLERLAIFGSEQERSLAAELLRLRCGVRRARAKLAMYDPVTVRQAWSILGELLDED